MATYKLISSVTVGAGGAASLSLTSIPADYTDLVFKFSGRRSTSSPYNVRLTFNSSGGTAYSGRYLLSDGSSAFSGSASGQPHIELFYSPGTSETSNTFNNTEIYIPNYTGSQNKSLSADMVSENNGTTVVLNGFTAGLWSSSSAITSITMTPESGSFVQYSTAYLYGIKSS